MKNKIVWIAIIIALILIGTLYLLASKYTSVRNSTEEYINWENNAGELENASDYLTEQVRYYVIIHEREYLDNYFLIRLIYVKKV